MTRTEYSFDPTANVLIKNEKGKYCLLKESTFWGGGDDIAVKEITLEPGESYMKKHPIPSLRKDLPPGKYKIDYDFTHRYGASSTIYARSNTLEIEVILKSQ